MAEKTVASIVHRFPERGKSIALIQKTDFRTFRYTYADIHRMACKVAHLLEKQGVKRGDKILLWGPNSVAWCVSFLGCILKGVVAVPLDVRSTPQFIKDIQAQVHAKVFFRTKYKLDPAIKIKTFFLEDLEFLLEELPATLPQDTAHEDDLVEILYTSGTTGMPKGVMLTHKNIHSNLMALQHIGQLAEHDTFLSVLPLSHIFEQTVGFLYPLSLGASICYLSSLKTSAMVKAFSSEHITLMLVVPRFLETFKNSILAQALEEHKEHLLLSMLHATKHLPLIMRRFLFHGIAARFGFHFKCFIVGGAPLDHELELFWESLGFPVIQGYGLTETAPIITANTLQEHKIGSVGKLLSNVDIALSPDGEVWVKGDNVTQGYYKNPQKNKESFEHGWFKTGDLGYLDKDGFLFIKGRKKDMIKTADGINVYPEDIENVLNKLSGVKEACVIGVKHGTVEEVHAVLLLDPKTKRDPRQIVMETNRHLDSAQQIQGFTVWPFDDFPRTPIMKVRKFVVLDYLARKKGKARETRTPSMIPDVDEKIYAILKSISKEPSRIAARATLGLDLKLGSIDRVELISLIEQELNVNIDEESITQTTTVADLERMIQEQKGTEEKRTFRPWTLSWPIRVLRTLSQEIFWFPLTRVFCSPLMVRGIEHLRDLKGEVVFVANHQSHLDTPLIIMNLLQPYHTFIAPAAWAEFFQAPKHAYFERFKRWLAYNLVTLDFNAYLFPQTKGFRRSLQYTGELLDKGWSVLLFPEGERSTDERVLQFKQGIGFIGAEMRVPIVPIRIQGLVNVLPRGIYWPKRGEVRITFGKPLVFKQESQVEIV
ncbi:AMP-binding protein, partial [Candidatus Woesearchaeota archaeon]|nr:AMP-binding protein [Candidatus Woesearchaeota archaeon]